MAARECVRGWGYCSDENSSFVTGTDTTGTSPIKHIEHTKYMMHSRIQPLCGVLLLGIKPLTLPIPRTSPSEPHIEVTNDTIYR